jgi:Trypsin
MGGTKIDGSDRRLYIEVDMEIPHPDYSTVTNLNDIMLVKLSSRVTSLPFQSLSIDVTKPQAHDVVKAVRTATNVHRMTANNRSYRYQQIGYGTTSEGGDLSYFLREVELDVTNFAICDTIWGGSIQENTQFCVRMRKTLAILCIVLIYI